MGRIVLLAALWMFVGHGGIAGGGLASIALAAAGGHSANSEYYISPWDGQRIPMAAMRMVR